MTSGDSRHPAAGERAVCSVLTPAGRGAIATIGVRGTGAVQLVGRWFAPASGKALSDCPAGAVVFGRFGASAAAAEELVVGILSKDDVEIHCHGGTAAVEAIMAALVSPNCQRIAWTEWAATRESDPLAAAALLALAAARTERTAAILLDQYHGALRMALSNIAQRLQTDLRGARQSLDELLSRADLGRHLTRPWRVVVTGVPNVGKSSLINALLGYQRSIVFDQPGTTRDVLTASTAIDGWPVELVDTAGLREGGDPIEAEGVARAQRQAAEADLVIEVLDASVGGRGSGSTSKLVVHNKCDLCPPARNAQSTELRISAKTGLGIDALIQAIGKRLVPNPPPRGAGVPFTESQITAIERTMESLSRGDIQATQRVER
jgi:tRNA modification GTPase